MGIRFNHSPLPGRQTGLEGEWLLRPPVIRACFEHALECLNRGQGSRTRRTGNHRGSGRLDFRAWILFISRSLRYNIRYLFG